LSTAGRDGGDVFALDLLDLCRQEREAVEGVDASRAGRDTDVV